MDINITGRHIEITNALRNYIKKRLSKIEKYFKDIFLLVNVTIFTEKSRHQIEVSLSSIGQVINAKVSTKDMYESIDKVIDKLEKQLKKQKEKQKNHTSKPVNKEIQKVESTYQEKSVPKTIKIQKFATKPMSLDEAIMQLSMQKKGFLVFLNSSTNQVNVIYYRKDGNIGLIEPTFK
ncbi:MAG: ribosome-associated translation inhibitor RaiA [bacterium]|nr:ribosome-associated translation inhibitor RaiA [bacterium]